MAGRLQDRVCLITGTGGSIGRAAAERFASEGARVVGCDISEAAASDCVTAVRSQGGEMVSLHPCDLRQPGASQSLVDFALDAFGGIDVLFNNAAEARFGWIEDLSSQDFADTLDAEASIVFNLTKAAWPALSVRGGSIVNMASVSGWIGYEALPGLAHAAGKGAACASTMLPRWPRKWGRARRRSHRRRQASGR